MLGPILMLLGLQRLSALTGSLLLNLEDPFTALIAVGLMREHLGGREMFAAATILLGGVLLSFQSGHIGGNWFGVMEIAAACLSWGIDDNLTQRVSFRDPVAVARIKALAAGTCVLGWRFGGVAVDDFLARLLLSRRESSGRSAMESASCWPLKRLVSWAPHVSRRTSPRHRSSARLWPRRFTASFRRGQT